MTEQASDLSRGARIGIGVVAAAAAVLSFSSLAALAHDTGYTSSVWFVRVSWLLPVALDAAAGVSTFVWLRARRPEVVVLARRLAWSTIALSVVGNGTQHALQAMGARPHWLVAVLVGATAPAVFGAVVHLAVVASSRPDVREASTESDRTASTSVESSDAEPWGGPPTVDVPRPLEQPARRPAAVTPMRRTTTSTVPAASRPQRMTHEPGWTPDMAAVPRGNWSADTWVRRRARALPNITQAGKKHADLRREVERAELEQARRTAGSADDEDREAVPA